MSATKNSAPTLSMCICTSGRVRELERCLLSIEQGSQLPDGVLVSDDSPTSQGQDDIRSICSRFPFVRYQEGPCRGLCANRNAVIAAARTTHVALVDDDAVVDKEFVQVAIAAISQSPSSILTGDVVEVEIGRCRPTNPTLWGHFGKPVRDGEPLRNINLNCNVFPRQAFADATFDERLTYGYEDTDLCDRLLKMGWRIEYVPEMVNRHLPPNPGDRGELAERERFVVLFRLRSRGVGKIAKLLYWVPAAGMHATAAYWRNGRLKWIAKLPLWLGRAVVLWSLGPCPGSLRDRMLTETP